MIKYILLGISIVLTSCSTEEAWSSSDYFIGDWEYETTIYKCCNTCVDNYEIECETLSGPSFAEITFFENGNCIRKWKHSGEEEMLVWCYNANIQELILKKENGVFTTFEDRYRAKDINDCTYNSEIRIVTASTVIHMRNLTRI